MISEGELLQQRAESGDPEAQTTLAFLLDKRGMHESALNWLRSASNNGYAPAQYVLGSRLVVGRAAPFDPNEGAKWVSSAAHQGMPEALATMSVLASLAGQWNEAVTFMKRAADNGHESARDQVELLASPQLFDHRQWDAPVEIDWKFKSPRIGVIKSFIPPAFCNWIMERARSKLEAVRVKDPTKGVGRAADYRSNSGAGFSVLESDLILQMVNARVADALDLPLSNQEPTNVLHYKKGEEYKPHCDYITASEANAAELASAGQRVATALIYLNDKFDGGETEFPHLKWKFKGKPGDALVFWNVNAERAPDPKTLHAGLPPKSGEKWLYSKWIRANPYPLI